MISLLHPTRERPAKSFRTTTAWMDMAGVETELIVSVDKDDPLQKEYLNIYPDALVNNNRSAVDAVNRAAEKATGDIMIVLSDDFECFPDWGKMVMHALKGRTDVVLKINDKIQQWIITMPILDRAYYNRFGYIYYPDYKHQFVDTDFSHVAYCLKKVLVRHDLVFPHLHPSVTKEYRDSVYVRNDRTWEQGKRLYLKRVKEGFGLGLNVWDIKDGGHRRWLRKNL